jgi:hypothetical protein
MEASRRRTDRTAAEAYDGAAAIVNGERQAPTVAAGQGGRRVSGEMPGGAREAWTGSSRAAYCSGSNPVFGGLPTRFADPK